MQLKLKDLTMLVLRDNGFYVTYRKPNGSEVELYFYSIDDFYSRYEESKLLDREILFIDVMKNRLSIWVR